MTKLSLFFIAVFSCVSLTSAFLPSSQISPQLYQVSHVTQVSQTQIKAMPLANIADMTSSFLAEVSEYTEEMTGPALDTYGQVDAPGWVLPVGALLVISTAALIPLALKPGAEAFEEERKRLENEEDPLA